jgi:hypothetical protein
MDTGKLRWVRFGSGEYENTRRFRHLGCWGCTASSFSTTPAEPDRRPANGVGAALAWSTIGRGGGCSRRSYWHRRPGAGASHRRAVRRRASGGRARPTVSAVCVDGVDTILAMQTQMPMTRSDHGRSAAPVASSAVAAKLGGWKRSRFVCTARWTCPPTSACSCDEP